MAAFGRYLWSIAPGALIGALGFLAILINAGPKIAFQRWVMGGCMAFNGFAISIIFLFQIVGDGPIKPPMIARLGWYVVLLFLFGFGLLLMLWGKIGYDDQDESPKDKQAGWRNRKFFFSLAIKYFVCMQSLLAADAGLFRELWQTIA